MMMLATRLGLRASDIAHLSFGKISWESSTIILSQFKIGKKIELLLLVDVGNAIIDYLKYGRKRSESPRIFLYSRVPFTAMTNAAVAGTLGRTIDASGVLPEESMAHILCATAWPVVSWRTRNQYLLFPRLWDTRVQPPPCLTLE